MQRSLLTSIYRVFPAITAWPGPFPRPFSPVGPQRAHRRWARQVGGQPDFIQLPPPSTPAHPAGLPPVSGQGRRQEKPGFSEMWDWGFTRSHLLKSKKVIIIPSDFRTLELLTVGKYLSHRRGWGGWSGIGRAKWKVQEGGGASGGPGCRSPGRQGTGPWAGIGLQPEHREGVWNVSKGSLAAGTLPFPALPASSF